MTAADVYATRASDALRAADNEISRVVLETCWPLDLNGNLTRHSITAWQRAELAAQIITDHVWHTRHIAAAAHAERGRP